MRGYRIAVVAPGGPVTPDAAERVLALAASVYPKASLEIHFDPQCFTRQGHFAGNDAARLEAFLRAANDPQVQAVWFARGGYGSGRVTEAALERLEAPAFDKTYLGYSDMGALLGGLYKAGVGRPAHGPMPGDIKRDGGEAAVLRSLSFLGAGEAAALEGSYDGGAPRLAYNIAILSSVLGTALEPPLNGHVLMLEEVGEYMYRMDRYLAQITGTPSVRTVAGIRLGRVSAVPANDPDFGLQEEAVMQYWCERSGIPYLGRADIGHDGDNKVVPFGL